MIKRQITAAMKVFLRVFLCLLTFIGKSFGDEIQLFATEDSDIILPCSPIGKDDLRHQVFDWKKNDKQEVFLYDKGKYYNNGKDGQNETFKNRIDFFQDQLQLGNASIHIKNTKLTDAGIYSCTFPLLKPPGQEFYIKLVVGTCPKPTIKILGEVQDGVKVQCEVRGAFPEPKMKLLNHANDTIDAKNNTYWNGNYFDIILQALVDKRDFYRCVVKQEKICHQIYSEETLVPMPSGFWKSVSTVLAVLFGVTIIAAIFFFLYWFKRNCSGKPNGNTTPSPQNQVFLDQAE